MAKSTEVMKSISSLIKIPELQRNLMEMSKGEYFISDSYTIFMGFPHIFSLTAHAYQCSRWMIFSRLSETRISPKSLRNDESRFDRRNG